MTVTGPPRTLFNGSAKKLGSTASRAGMTHKRRDYLLDGRNYLALTAIEERSRASTGWWQRTDPFWEDTLFDACLGWACNPGIGRVWRSSAPFPVEDDTPADDPKPNKADISKVDSETLELMRRAVGMLSLAGIMSVEQVAAMLGVEPQQAASRLFEPLSWAGITEGAWFHPSGAPYPRVLLWRVRREQSYDRFVREALRDGTAPRWWCGTDPWAAVVSRSHVRHQVLAVEFVLRALEHPDNRSWVGWLPEGCCLPEHFVAPDNPAHQTSFNVRADGCLIRADGLRVFLEVQTSTSVEEIEEKILRWSELFTAGGAPGSVVLFVAAPRAPKIAIAAKTLQRCLTERVSDSLADRFFGCLWADLFPDHGQISELAHGLRVIRGASGGIDDEELIETQNPDTDTTLPSRLTELAPTPVWLTPVNGSRPKPQVPSQEMAAVA